MCNHLQLMFLHNAFAVSSFLDAENSLFYSVVKEERKMISFSLQDEELLAEEVKLFPVLYDKTEKGYKEKDVVTNAWVIVAEKLDFIENGIVFNCLLSRIYV